MANEQITKALESILFTESDAQIYAVLDGAAMPKLLGSLHTHQPEYECLYRGELKPDIAEVAPYLVHLDPNTDFPWWLISKGWGLNWGIFVHSRSDLRALRRHFRKFLIVYDETGKPLYFRWYDPRVLRVYLKTCNAEELSTVFGPVEAYVLESEDPEQALRFSQESGELKTEQLSLTLPEK